MNKKDHEQWLMALEIELMGLQARNLIRRIGLSQKWQRGQNGPGDARAKTARLYSKLERSVEASAMALTS